MSVGIKLIVWVLLWLVRSRAETAQERVVRRALFS